MWPYFRDRLCITFVLHAPLQLHNDNLACQVIEEGLGVDGHRLQACSVSEATSSLVLHVLTGAAIRDPHCQIARPNLSAALLHFAGCWNCLKFSRRQTFDLDLDALMVAWEAP